MKLLSKKHAQRIHAKRRAFERYGKMFNREDMHAMIKMIQRAEAKILAVKSHRIVIKQIEYQNEIYVVAYDKQRHQIVTFLPRDWKDDQIE